MFLGVVWGLLERCFWGWFGVYLKGVFGGWFGVYLKGVFGGGLELT